MNAMRPLLLLGAALLATACAEQPTLPSAAPPPPAMSAACDATKAQFAVGQAQTAPLVEEVRQKSGAHMARVLRPGQVVTMEFSGDRVNIQVDAANKVTAVRCG